MAEQRPQSNALTVSLELDDAFLLDGDLSLEEGEQLEMRPSDTGLQATAHRMRLREGYQARLHCKQIAGTPVSLDVIVVNNRDDGISLTLKDRLLDDAQRCLSALSSSTDLVPTAVARDYSDVQRAQLLQKLQTQSLTLLDERLQLFIMHLVDHLFDLSTSTQTSSSGHNVYYEALNAVRRNGRGLIDSFKQCIGRLYEDLTPQEQGRQDWQKRADGSLDLIDINEFEDFLAIDRMIGIGEELHQVALEALIIRVATLFQADPLKVRLPVHVAELCRAFKASIDGQGIPKSVVPEILGFFVNEFIRELDNYYSPLNASLAQHGVRPHLEAEIINKGSLLQQAEKSRSVVPKIEHKRALASDPKPPLAAPEKNERQFGEHLINAAENTNKGSHQQTGNMIEQVVEGVVDKISKHLDPNNLYRSVIDALNFKRENEGTVEQSTGATAQGAGGEPRLADPQAIASALGALQRNAEVRNDLQQAASLREYLSANSGQIGGLEDTTGLSDVSLNQLDLVDNLFGTIRSQLDVSNELKPTLSNLQIPLAKLALMEPRFFLDRDHAARSVVDKLSKLSSAANFPNRALEGRLGEIVEQIVNDYDDDSTVFDHALGKIDKLIEQQERAHSRNVERVVRTQQGQEKLSNSKQAVENAVGHYISPPETPKVLKDLIEHGWRDLLVLTHVKEGADSEGWKEQLRTLALVSQWLYQQQQGQVDNETQLQRGLEAEPLIDMIRQQIGAALPANIAHEAVLDQLQATIAGNQPIQTIPIAPRPAIVTAIERRARIEQLPRLRRWVKRVEELETGSWLNYRNKAGKKQRMQLVWINEDGDRYVFVNDRGQKNADMSNVQLARHLSRGAKPPAPADEMSVIDESMYGTLEHVQKTLNFDRNHDALTKLINRDIFLDQMKRTLGHAHRKASQHAVLYINIDQFSLVNEVYDQVNGDLVLLEFAKLLSQLHGKKTASARLGGDEFAILLVDKEMEKAIEFAEKVRVDIESSSVEIENENVSFTVSIGVAPLLSASTKVEDVLADARGAMQIAKEQGRNRVVEYTQDQELVLRSKKDLENSRLELEQALATDRFVLRAQPIVQSTVVSGEEVSAHYELLLGLSNPDGTLGSPEEFIESAERCGFMSLVDRWVVKEAFSWISSLMDAQKVVPNLAINLSGTSVTDDAFMDYLLEQISEFGVGTSKLCFEITETGTISNLVKAADFVRIFRNIGCKFSIDDFGTGLASHNYLRELPVDYVKIDGTFITNIHNNRNDFAMAKSINDLAHFLGQETIAESVENEEIIEQLNIIGVDYLQGWGIGHPKLLSEVAAELASIDK
ncbi:MAG: diguanylate cyclase (GGDEF)-like protein [Halieaceae bacterium]|jgi:diguanylate cyclase (GGDEF)-like protein